MTVTKAPLNNAATITCDSKIMWQKLKAIQRPEALRSMTDTMHTGHQLDRGGNTVTIELSYSYDRRNHLPNVNIKMTDRVLIFAKHL